jgi:hypothetical protein
MSYVAVGAVGASNGDALHRLVITLVLDGSMQHECVGIVLRPDSRMARWGIRYAALRERKVRKFLVHCLIKSVFASMVGNIFMDRLTASLSKPVAS